GVDPHSVDLGLELLGFRFHQFQLTVPALGVNRAPGTQVQAGDVLGLAVEDRGNPQQVGRGVVAGMAPQADGVLAGHRCEVSEIVGGGIGHVTGSEYMIRATNLQIAVYVQATLAVALGAQLLGQRTGSETHGPDHRVTLDVASVGEGHAVGIHCRDHGAGNPLDAEVVGSLDDGGADAVTHDRANTLAAVDDDHPYILLFTQHGTQARRHFGGGFDPGEASAG